MRALDRRSLFSFLALVLVFAPLAGAWQQKPHKLRAVLDGPGSAATVVDYSIAGDVRTLDVLVVDIPLSEVTVVLDDETRVVVPLNASGDGAISADSRTGRDVPFLKAGDLVAVLGTVRGSTRVLLKGFLKPAD
jgi:hypothetical protein